MYNYEQTTDGNNLNKTATWGLVKYKLISTREHRNRTYAYVLCLYVSACVCRGSAHKTISANGNMHFYNFSELRMAIH